MKSVALREKPPLGKNFSHRRWHQGNQSVSRGRRWGKSTRCYDGTSGVPEFKNGAITGAFAYTFGSIGQRNSRTANDRFDEFAANGGLSIGPDGLAARIGPGSGCMSDLCTGNSFGFGFSGTYGRGNVGNAARTQPYNTPNITLHAKQQMIGRNVSQERVLDTINRGTMVSKPNSPVVRYNLSASQSSSGRGTTVVQDVRSNNVITVIDRGSKF